MGRRESHFDVAPGFPLGPGQSKRFASLAIF